MSNSPLVAYTKLSPNHSGKRTMAIDRITPHCVVGQLSCESICACFSNPAKKASCNYGIGCDGRISLCVDEGNRSWCSSSNANDQRAVTIECASDPTEPYAFKDVVYNRLIDLCEDICKRNGKKKLLWFGDKDKTMNYKPAADEMILTVHRWFANKSCPGNWMYAKMDDLAEKVTARLDCNVKSDPETSNTIYRVQIGAYSVRTNADAQLAKVKAAGFDAFVTKVDNLYKVQVGAYNVKQNAENQLAKVKAKGFDAFIATIRQGSSTSAAPTLKVFDKVKMAKDAPVYGKSIKFQDWVYDSILYVREINNDKIIVSTLKSGYLTGAVDRKYLTKI